MLKRVVLLLFISLSILYSFEIGSFDSRYWNGIILNDSGNIYGFRFAIEKKGKTADGYDTFFLVEEPGVISNDYSYAEISFNTNLEFGLKSKTPIRLKTTEKKGILKLIYGKYGKGVIGYLSIPDNIILKFYSPWNMGKNIIYKDGIFISPETNFKFLSIKKKLSPPVKKIKFHLK